ncbi:MAG TPA: nucleotidyltransferase family protein [Thermoanaerobaculia bacterium]
MADIAIEIDKDKLRDFCRRWKITEFALFGSVVREDFRPESDVDVLVTFAPGAPWSLFHMVDMQEELEAMFGRSVDLLTRNGVERSLNRFRREAILDSAVTLDVA